MKLVPKLEYRRCAIYGRVSDDEAANREHGSLEQQEHMGRALADQMSASTGIKHQVSHVLIEDKAVSGGTTKRPKYQQLLKLVREQKIDVVLAKEISRVNRSVKDFCDFMHLCQENDVAVHIKNLDINPNLPMGKAMFQMLAVVAELERELIRERTRSGIRSAMKNNAKINGGVIILGFDRHPEKKGVWLPNKVELRNVTFIMEKFVETLSYKQTLRIIGRHGITNKNGKPFTSQSLKGLLSNRKLIGKLSVPSESAPTEVDLPFGAVVPIDLFWKVQQAISTVDEKLGTLNRSGKHRVYALTGLLFFEDGTSFKGTSGKGRLGDVHYYYRNAENDLTLNAPAIEQAVIDALRIFEKDERMLEVASELKKTTVSKADIVRQQKSALESQLADLERNIERKLLDLEFSREQGLNAACRELDRKLVQLDQEREKIKEVLCSLANEESELASNVIDPKALRHSLKQLFDKLHTADDAVKRGIFRQLFKNITVYRKNQVKVTWAIPTVNESGKVFVSGMRWLLRQDLNLRPSD